MQPRFETLSPSGLHVIAIFSILCGLNFLSPCWSGKSYHLFQNLKNHSSDNLLLLPALSAAVGARKWTYTPSKNFHTSNRKKDLLSIQVLKKWGAINVSYLNLAVFNLFVAKWVIGISTIKTTINAIRNTIGKAII